MVRTAIVGLGKMGISHLAILGAHAEVELVGACDGLSYLTRNLEKHSRIPGYTSFDEMMQRAAPEAVFVATPTSSHAAIARAAMGAGSAVFCEKPLSLDFTEASSLAGEAEERKLANQVGYHNRFIATFEKASRIVKSGVLGRVHHIRGEAYGPVVTKPYGSTWRASKTEGGGVTFDYASHVVDLIHFVVDRIDTVDGVVRRSVFSRSVDDEVYATLMTVTGISGQLSVNWSDPSCRKMTTRLSVWGEHGSMSVDRQECSVFLNRAISNEEGVQRGWTTFNITQLTEMTDYYLRGEEYTRQIDYFIDSIRTNRINGTNDFRSAADTDRVIGLINSYDVAEKKHSRSERNPSAFDRLIQLVRPSRS